MQIYTEVLKLHTLNPFIIARGGNSEWPVVWLRLRDRDGVEGWGEAAPSMYYGETIESVLAAIKSFDHILSVADDWSIEDIEAALEKTLRWNAAARSAVSAALHDMHGKRLGAPLWKIWGLSREKTPLSSFTIGIAPDEETLRSRVREASGYPILKVKLGSDRDKQILKTVREEAPNAVIRVDANSAWTAKHTLAMLDVLVENGVEMLEQPLPFHDIAGLKFVKERSVIPVFADESCVTSFDIPRIADAVDGINIKLMKCGSLREALRMIATARSHGLKVMCGCMIESSLGIAAAAHFTPLLDYVDLDGSALLSDDPFVGPSIAVEGRLGQVSLSEEPGLGVVKRS